MSNSLIARFVELERKVAEQDRRSRNRKRTGTISEVDLEKGLARVKLQGGEKDYISPWMPWKEPAAGGIKTHIPPTIGEQVDVVSESGDLTDAVIDSSTPSNANPRPHNGPEGVITKGSVRIMFSDDAVTIDAPSIIYTAGSGELK